MSPEHPLAERLRSRAVQNATRVVTYGVDGIGKTEFGKRSPSPFFLCAEISQIPKSIPALQPQDWPDVIKIIRSLQKDPMECKTFVLDTLDWLEPKVVEYVCRRDNRNHSGKLILAGGRPYLEGYGYNRGPGVVLLEWRLLLGELDQLLQAQNMNIILLSHASTHRIKNESGDDYGQIGPGVEKKASDLFCQWADAVLYAEFEKTVIRVADESKLNGKAKVVTDGSRICWTQSRGAHRAKNRFSMPEKIPFSWANFARYALADLAELRHQVERKLASFGDPELIEKVSLFLEDQPVEAGIFYQVLGRLNQIQTERNSDDGRQAQGHQADPRGGTVLPSDGQKMGPNRNEKWGFDG